MNNVRSFLLSVILTPFSCFLQSHFFFDLYQLSLADIKTANAIDHFACQPKGDELIEIIKTSPALWKVKETVDSHPKLAKWRVSEEFKELEASTKAFYDNPYAFM